MLHLIRSLFVRCVLRVNFCQRLALHRQRSASNVMQENIQSFPDPQIALNVLLAQAVISQGPTQTVLAYSVQSEKHQPLVQLHVGNALLLNLVTTGNVLRGNTGKGTYVAHARNANMRMHRT